jgi:Thioester domain/PEP-CTERM motif
LLDPCAFPRCCGKPRDLGSKPKNALNESTRFMGDMMRPKAILPMIALFLSMTQLAEAGQITNLQLYDGTSGSPTVTINYTNADGTGINSAYVYADPQVSSGTTVPMYYCVDLWHDNYIGSTYTINPVSTMTFSTSTYSDVDNRIGWLLTQDQSTPDARAAVQLAIWYTMDNVVNNQLAGFSISTSDSTITSDYNTLISFAGYHSNVAYAADFWQATHDPSNTLYQNLVSAPSSGGINVGSVPEPGSLVLTGIGLLSLAGVHFWRRRV